MSEKKQQLISAAYNAFYQFGFTASGIDSIIKDAGVSKKTLYNHFESKNELIREVINYYVEQFEIFITAEFSELDLVPTEKVLYVFDATKKWVSKTKHHGCLVTNAVSELDDDHHKEILKSCHRFKNFQKDLIKSLIEETGAKNTDELAVSLVLVLEGAIATSKVFGKDKIFDNAKQIAKGFLPQ